MVNCIQSQVQEVVLQANQVSMKLLTKPLRRVENVEKCIPTTPEIVADKGNKRPKVVQVILRAV